MCIRNLLETKIEEHNAALQERNSRRELCAQTLNQLRFQTNTNTNTNMNTNNDESNTTNNIINNTHPRPHLQVPVDKEQPGSSARHQIHQCRDQIEILSKSIEHLRDECSTKSISLASLSVQQSNRVLELETKRSSVLMLRDNLDLLRSSILMGNGNDVVVDVDVHVDVDADVDVDKADGMVSSSGSINISSGFRAKGNLASTIETYVEQVKQRRFQLVLETFAMHRMDVGHEHQSLTMEDLMAGLDDEGEGTRSEGKYEGVHNDDGERRHDENLPKKGQKRSTNAKQKSKLQPRTTQIHNSKPTNANAFASTTTPTPTTTPTITRFQKRVRQRIPSGIGKIGGSLPLPHRGPSVYNTYLPANVLSSSIRLIASLTNVLARCLSIELPHPIVLCPMVKDDESMTATSISSGSGRYGMRHEDLWLRDQTADIVECAAGIHIGANEDNDNHDILPREGLTLMKDLEDLDRECDDDRLKVGEEGGHDGDNYASIGKNDMFDPTNQRPSEHSAGMSTNTTTPFGKASLSMSTSSLRSLVGSSSNLLSRAFDKMKGHHHQHASGSHHHNPHPHHRHHHHSYSNQHGNVQQRTSAILQVPMDKDSVALRLKYATHAIIYESNKNSQNNGNSVVKYELKPPSSVSANSHTRAHSHAHAHVHADQSREIQMQQQEEEHFTIGLQLLQNDIVALCIQAGVPVRMLWPAEAMLLNLNSLKLYVMELLKEQQTGTI